MNPSTNQENQNHDTQITKPSELIQSETKIKETDIKETEIKETEIKQSMNNSTSKNQNEENQKSNNLSPVYLSSPNHSQSINLPNQKLNHSSLRLRKGMRLEDSYSTSFSIHQTSLDPSSFLHSIESPFQVQEYITLLVRSNPHDVDQIISLPSPNIYQSPNPITPGTPNPSSLVSQEVWIYEQLRRFSQDLSYPFVSTLQTECSRTTCPEMKAGEWLYLCAAHATANENDCCAIDYIVHTLDGATALLNSARYFPSRLQIPTTSIKHFTSIARRLYRIFAHAWFHHRDIFDQCETETSLYARFLALTDRFSLISEDLLVIPRTNEEEAPEEEEEGNESIGSNLDEKQETNEEEEDEELEELE